MPALLRRLEQSTLILSAIKLANAGLILIWGIGVTFVFARALSTQEFQNFLLLFAIGNFTISAEFGFTNIIYNRLRRRRLGVGGAFSFTEITMLYVAIGLLIVLASVGIALCFAAGIIVTGKPLLFIAFFIYSTLAIAVLLSKRVLAALDRNLLYEFTDILRRLICLGLLVAVLFGLDITLSVLLQLAATMGATLLWCLVIHHVLRLRWTHWRAAGKGAGIVRRRYMADMRSSILLTLTEIGAYNMPYLTLSLVSSDPRPIILYDFLYKLMRAAGTIMRALAEAFLPRITSAVHGSDRVATRRYLLRCLGLGGLVAAGMAGVLEAMGGRLFHLLFAGKGEIDGTALAIVSLAMLLLPIVSLSSYIHGALGAFDRLVRASVPFIIGATIAAPLALALGDAAGWPNLFMGFFTGVYLLVALIHLSMLRRLQAVQPSADVR